MESKDYSLLEYHIRDVKQRNPFKILPEGLKKEVVIDKWLGEDRKEAVVPAEIDGYQVTRIGKEAFKNCKQLEVIELPDTVYSIETEAFAGCESLHKINLPAGLKHIMCGIFRNCTGLIEIELPDSLSNISFETFQGCTSLRKVKLPKQMRDLGNDVFSGCVSLEEISLPERITALEEKDIGKRKFDQCSGTGTGPVH